MPAKEAKTPTSAMISALKAPPTVTINIPLPVDLHRKLRIKAITVDLPLKDAVAAAIEQWVA